MTIPKKVEHVELLIINQQGISHCSFEASVISTMLSSPLLILGDPENSALQRGFNQDEMMGTCLENIWHTGLEVWINKASIEWRYLMGSMTNNRSFGDGPGWVWKMWQQWTHLYIQLGNMVIQQWIRAQLVPRDSFWLGGRHLMATLTQSLLFSPILKASSHGSHADTRIPGCPDRCYTLLAPMDCESLMATCESSTSWVTMLWGKMFICGKPNHKLSPIEVFFFVYPWQWNDFKRHSWSNDGMHYQLFIKQTREWPWLADWAARHCLKWLAFPARINRGWDTILPLGSLGFSHSMMQWT